MLPSESPIIQKKKCVEESYLFPKDSLGVQIEIVLCELFDVSFLGGEVEGGVGLDRTVQGFTGQGRMGQRVGGGAGKGEGQPTRHAHAHPHTCATGRLKQHVQFYINILLRIGIAE